MNKRADLMVEMGASYTAGSTRESTTSAREYAGDQPKESKTRALRSCSAGTKSQSVCSTAPSSDAQDHEGARDSSNRLGLRGCEFKKLLDIVCRAGTQRSWRIISFSQRPPRYRVEGFLRERASWYLRA